MSNYGSILVDTIRPFGHGVSNVATVSTGVQYGATLSTSYGAGFTAFEEITVPVPTNGMVTELLLGLTVGLGITVTTDCPYFRIQLKDNAQSSYDTLFSIASTILASLVSTTTLVDFTASRVATPSDGTYFTGRGPFQVQCLIAPNASTSKALGAMKSSSYLTYRYYLVG